MIASRAAKMREQETGAPAESVSQAEANAYLAQAEQEYIAQQRGGAGGFMPAAYGGGASAYDGNGIAPTMETQQQEGEPMPQWVIPAAIGAVALLMLTQRR